MSVLPTGYTANDSSRMTLGFFILSALDLLGQDEQLLSEEERAAIKNWILRCQLPDGGFCGSTNHKFPDGHYVNVGNMKQFLDPPNLPATFFALLSLSYVGDLNWVKRRQCLRWLKTLQRKDGSFGELITADGTIAGGMDMRHCYVATAIRWMLRSEELDDPNDDIDVEKLVDHIRNGQVVYILQVEDIANSVRHTTEESPSLLSMNLTVGSPFKNSPSFSNYLYSWIFVLRHCVLAFPRPTSPPFKDTLLGSSNHP